MEINNLFKYWTYSIFSPGTVLREKYQAFKSLLRHDKRAHEVMAELEEVYYNRKRVDMNRIEGMCTELSDAVYEMIECLIGMAPVPYVSLRDYHKKIDFYIRFILAPPEFQFGPPYTLDLRESIHGQPQMIGGKASQLNLMKTELDLPVPEGFVITTNAFRYFLEFNDLQGQINSLLAKVDIDSVESLEAISSEIESMIIGARVPPDISDAVFSSFLHLKTSTGPDVKVAMRSSAVSEDSEVSFAGQYRTVLNVAEEQVAHAYKRVIASKYTPRAMYYRINYGLSDQETSMAVIVLEMIDSAVSGVMYTAAIGDSDQDKISIHSTWGLGEALVSGEVSPDIFEVSKAEKPVIIGRHLGEKAVQIISQQDGTNRKIAVADEKKHLFTLDDTTVHVLAEWALKLERHYGEPQDIEWCMDSSGRLLILQTRPLQAGQEEKSKERAGFEGVDLPVLLSGGDCASGGLGAGRVFRVKTDRDLLHLSEGSVLVAANASPHYVKVLNKLSAVVTDVGSIAGHFASVAREFGVPVLVNTGKATSVLEHGREVTVWADGQVVYQGIDPSATEIRHAAKDFFHDSTYMRRLKYIIDFVSPLRLVDPESPDFSAENCRSFHDIIRFVHEKAVYEMFTISDRAGGKIKGARELISRLPILCYVVDVGGGLKESACDQKKVEMDQVKSVPLNAVWKGISHPGIKWGDFTHFNWKEFDEVAMAGGFISKSSPSLASYAVISGDYLNFNMKFGYHFVIIDTICGDDTDQNYISFRFAGGGGDFHGRYLRAEFIGGILERLGFKVDRKGDLLDAQIVAVDRATVEERLDQLGRLMGATRLMDMYMKDESMVRRFVDEFMNERYHFASVTRDE
ncbi:MAG TPA: hypothetical protein EYP57_08710 [Thermodesulfobacteriaceae bacterium]|nr:hypothetical protein [Thermodesulfobacteriaceae bacterium]